MLNTMDSAGGTVTEGRDKEYQAVYKLKGKVKNVFGLEEHKGRQNNEIDDLLSILRCGTGNNFSLEKLKFDKIIILADSDDDGKHIELLTVTLFHEYLPGLIEAGKLFIGISPLYKVAITGKPMVYLNTPKDLAEFFANQIGELFKFIDSDSGKEITKPSKKTANIAAMLDYQNSLQKAADNYGISPESMEAVFLVNFDQNTAEFDDSVSERIEFKELANGNLGITGFYTNDDQEYFVSLNVEPASFVETLTEMQNKFLGAMGCDFVNKRGVTIAHPTLFQTIQEITDTVRKSVKISRLKGLGEVNAVELWDTALNPETRRLDQVHLIEDSEIIVKAYMGSDPEFRKEFLKETFASAIADAESVSG